MDDIMKVRARLEDLNPFHKWERCEPDPPVKEQIEAAKQQAQAAERTRIVGIIADEMNGYLSVEARQVLERVTGKINEA